MKKFVSILLILICCTGFIGQKQTLATDILSTGSIKVGDYIQFGSYNSEPILWRVIHSDGNGYMLFSEKILCFKAFDAPESGIYGKLNSNYPDDFERQRYGTNNWQASNLREWLNSNDSVVRYSSQSPTDSAVSDNAYDKEAGFLNNFTLSEQAAIKTVRHKSILAPLDIREREGGSEQFSDGNYNVASIVSNYDKAYYRNVDDKVFLLDVKELKEYVYDRGWNYLRKPTDKAFECYYNPYEDSSTKDQYYEYWLRTPLSFSNYQRSVESDGDVLYSGPGLGNIGVVPAVIIREDTLIASGNGAETTPYIVTRSTSTNSPSGTPDNTPTPIPTMTPTPGPQAVTDICFLNGIYTRVDNAGNIETSTDCVNWKKTYKAPKGYDYKLISGRNEISLLIDRSSGENLLLKSPDGIVWNEVPGFGNVYDLKYLNGMYIGVGYSTIKTSVDGLNWVTQDSNGSSYLNSVIYKDNEFIIAGGYMGSGRIQRSSDPNNWPKWEEIYTFGDDSFYKIVGNDKGFLMLSNFLSLLASNDLKAVERVKGVDSPYNVDQLADIECNNNVFIAVSKNCKIFISPDTKNWNNVFSSNSIHINKVKFINNRFFIVGDIRGNKAVYTSIDGVNWIDAATNIDIHSFEQTATPTPASTPTPTLKPTSNTLKYCGYVIPDFSFSDNASNMLKSGFTVKIKNTNLETITDENGYFEISNIPAQNSLTISISKQNYLTRELSMVATPPANFGTQQIPMPMWIGDINNDNAINMKDIIGIASAFNSALGYKNFKPDFDINKDNAINLLDIMIVAKHFNSTSSSYPFFNSESEVDMHAVGDGGSNGCSDVR